jgi:hypothetical protein
MITRINNAHFDGGAIRGAFMNRSVDYNGHIDPHDDMAR